MTEANGLECQSELLELTEIEKEHGFLTNGGNFTFLKLMSHSEGFTYAISDEFNLCNRQNGCYPVLQILKRLANQFLNS